MRLQQTGHSHFITFTCYHRAQHLTDPRVCCAVLRALENTRKRYELRVYGFVLMPEHVHLLLGEPKRETLAQALQSPKSASARMALRWRRKAARRFGRHATTTVICGAMMSSRRSCVYSPQSGAARIVCVTGAVAMEQLSTLQSGHCCGSGDRVRANSSRRRDSAAMRLTVAPRVGTAPTLGILL